MKISLLLPALYIDLVYKNFRGGAAGVHSVSEVLINKIHRIFKT